MSSQIPEAGQYQQPSAAALDLRMLQLPSGVMGNKDRVHPRAQRGINIAPRTISHHPGIRLHYFELVDDALVCRRVLFTDDFDRLEMRLQSGALHLRRLLGSFALGQQNQSMMPREISQRFRHSIQDMWRRVLHHADQLVNPLHHVALGWVSGQLHVGIFERALEASHSIAMLPNIPPLRLIQNMPRIFARVTKRLHPRNEFLDGLLEENIVLPERIVSINQESLPRHCESSPKYASLRIGLRERNQEALRTPFDNVSRISRANCCSSPNRVK